MVYNIYIYYAVSALLTDLYVRLREGRCEVYICASHNHLKLSHIMQVPDKSDGKTYFQVYPSVNHKLPLLDTLCAQIVHVYNR